MPPPPPQRASRTTQSRSHSDFGLHSFGMTHVGQVRSVNQDSFFCDDGQGLYIVADGMGGHAGGEIASKAALKYISEYLGQNLQVKELNDADAMQNATVLQELGSAINHASAKIYEMALEDPLLRGMGTTATMVKVIGARAFVGHVGDSRLYLYRCGFLYQVTKDHSLISEQVRAGLLTEEEAESHKLRNVITRSVGYQEEEEVDCLSFDLRGGDLLLLCSDGLTGELSNTEIATVLGKDIEFTGKNLVDQANQQGGEDNITIVLVEAKESGQSTDE